MLPEECLGCPALQELGIAASQKGNITGQCPLCQGSKFRPCGSQGWGELAVGWD